MEEEPPTELGPSAEAEHTPEKLEAAVAAVIAEENFVPELCECRGEGPWNPLLVARAVLCAHAEP